MKTYVMQNFPAVVHDFEEPKDTKVTLMFTPDPDALYPLGIGLNEIGILVTVPLDELIKKVKNDMKEGKL